MVHMGGGRMAAEDHLVELVPELIVPPGRIFHRLEAVKYTYLSSLD